MLKIEYTFQLLFFQGAGYKFSGAEKEVQGNKNRAAVSFSRSDNSPALVRVWGAAEPDGDGQGGDDALSVPERLPRVSGAGAAEPLPQVSVSGAGAAEPPPPVSVSGAEAADPPPPVSVSGAEAAEPPPPVSVSGAEAAEPPPPASAAAEVERPLPEAAEAEAAERPPRAAAETADNQAHRKRHPEKWDWDRGQDFCRSGGYGYRRTRSAPPQGVLQKGFSAYSASAVP